MHGHAREIRVAAGSVEGKKADVLVVESLKPLAELRLYAWGPMGFMEIGLIEEGGVPLQVLTVADVDRDLKGELLYYTPVFEDPEKATGAFVVLRKQGDKDNKWIRRVHPISPYAQPQALVAGRLVDPKLTTLAIDAAWWMPEDPEYAYDDMVFFTWDGKGFRQDPKIRLKYDAVSLVPLDLDGDGRDEFLILGDGTSTYEERHKKCQFEVYGYDVKVKGMKPVAQRGPDRGQRCMNRRERPTSSMGSGGSRPSWRGNPRISRRGAGQIRSGLRK